MRNVKGVTINFVTMSEVVTMPKELFNDLKDLDGTPSSAVVDIRGSKDRTTSSKELRKHISNLFIPSTGEGRWEMEI